MDGLGRSYFCMVLAAIVAIAIDQALRQTPMSSARIALAGAVGAAIGLGLIKLAAFAHRSR